MPALTGLVQQTRRRRAELLRWRRPVGVVVLVLVTVVGLQTQPRPSLHGLGLLVLVSLAAVLIGGAVLLLGVAGRPLPKAVDVVLFGAVFAGSIALVWVAPGGTGFFGGFVLAGTAASRWRGWVGTGFTLVFVASLAVAGLLGANRPPVQIALSVLGVVAFYRLARYADGLRRRTDESERLLAELEDTKAAQVRAAALAEQQRLAREMHDVLAHSLSGLLVHLEGARLLAVHTGADPRLTDAVARAHHLAQAGLAEAREAIGTLRDEDAPGPERLASLTEAFERDTGVPCVLTMPGAPPELPAQTRLTLYRVAQEALTNVRKHAQADRVEVRLVHGNERVALSKEDWGRPAPEPADDHGYGVSGMRERAELLGGRLTTGPTAAGFRVLLEVPV
jgi:signal transduction histidine kinase